MSAIWMSFCFQLLHSLVLSKFCDLEAAAHGPASFLLQEFDATEGSVQGGGRKTPKLCHEHIPKHNSGA